jgi:4-hydroxy-3-methylbut-2-en-1-yl diphosphate synthase IspG/GcpE
MLCPTCQRKFIEICALHVRESLLRYVPYMSEKVYWDMCPTCQRKFIDIFHLYHYIMMRTSYIQRDDNDVHFVLDQHA